MTSLRAFQEEIRNLVFYREEEKEKSFLWKDAVPSRLNVYRNNTRMNWSGALDHDFPFTRQQFAETEWESLKRRYFIQHAPQHWELNTALTPFPKFLAKQKCPAYVKELAEYEWADLQIFIHRAKVEKGAGVTNPTLLVRVFQYQMFDWAQAGAPKANPPRPTPEVLVFHRDAKNTCHIQEADPLMLLLIDHFRRPRARLEALEPVRRKLLPQNTASLTTVLAALESEDIIL